jgi:ABC-type cobalamin transport system permease subunit
MPVLVALVVVVGAFFLCRLQNGIAQPGPMGVWIAVIGHAVSGVILTLGVHPQSWLELLAVLGHLLGGLFGPH